MTSDDDEANAFLQHALMEETRSYVERGRALKDRSDLEVADLWVATVAARISIKRFSKDLANLAIDNHAFTATLTRA